MRRVLGRTKREAVPAPQAGVAPERAGAPVSVSTGAVEEFPWSCVDDNSLWPETRCASFQAENDHELTAS